ncbi:hypothetical protein [Nocardioides ochotonae]|uniref:hypothetical protein n=1 Tax=Nocardioides ochotonae TaxID=2685869 RepID=UPI00140E7E33|nr:hypothetical protein [Nocardioides ochotonae]
MADADYCDLCDLPFSTCVHGMPKPVPAPEPPPKASTPRVRTARVPGTREAPPRVVPRKWTQPHELVPHVIAVLDEAGGELDGEGMFEALEERLADVLKPGDREKNPQGELRWRAAARKARKELIDTGVLVAAGPGVWKLA